MARAIETEKTTPHSGGVSLDINSCVFFLHAYSSRYSLSPLEIRPICLLSSALLSPGVSSKFFVASPPASWLAALRAAPDLSRRAKEKAAYLGHLLCEKGGASRLESRLLRADYGTRGLPEVVTFLTENGLLEVGESYLPGGARPGFCKTYSLPPAVLASGRAEVLCKWSPRVAAKKKAKARKAAENLAVFGDTRDAGNPDLPLSPAQSYVKTHLERLTVVPDYVEEFDPKERAFVQLAAIQAGKFYAWPSGTGKLYSSLTNLKKEARKYLRLDGQPLEGWDFQSFYPSLLLSIVAPAERAKMAEWLGSDFYTRLAAGLAEPMERAKVKTEFNAGLNDQNSHEWLYPAFRRFVFEFPHTAEAIRKIKMGDRKDPHKALARRFQQVEAKLIFGEIVTALKDRGIPVISLHDALYTLPAHSAAVREEMENAIARQLGVPVGVKAA